MPALQAAFTVALQRVSGDPDNGNVMTGAGLGIPDCSRRLEAAGLVERRQDPDDARAARIFLTGRSREFEPVAGAVLADLERAVKGRLGTARAAELRAALGELFDLR